MCPTVRALAGFYRDIVRCIGRDLIIARTQYFIIQNRNYGSKSSSKQNKLKLWLMSIMPEFFLLVDKREFFQF